MKKIILLLVGITLFSCSSNEDETPVEPTPTPTPVTSDFTNAIPMNDGNYWNYIVEGQTTTNDHLYIFGDNVIGAYTYKKFKTENNVATGFYSSSLNNNDLRKDNGKLLLTGNLSLPQGQTLPIGLDLSVSDFIIFKEYATNGELLNEKTGSFEQTVNGIPLTVYYKLKAIGGENIGTFTTPAPDSTTYQNVKSTKIVVNLKVTTTIMVGGIPYTTTVLNPQDVVVSTQYLSKNIGVVYTKTITSYNLDAAVASNLGIPASNTQTQEEFLDTYNVN